jgi:hypothetical protein
LEHEKRRLEHPWRLVLEADGRYAWHGGAISKRYKGISVPSRHFRLIYPTGYPARFVEARLEPDLPKDQWGMLGVHVNSDGSACYVNADGWSPQDTVFDAVQMLERWWWNYYWIVEEGRGGIWPANGFVSP